MPRDPDPLTFYEAHRLLAGAAWGAVADLLETLPQRWAWVQDAVDAAWCAAGAAYEQADREHEEALRGV